MKIKELRQNKSRLLVGYKKIISIIGRANSILLLSVVYFVLLPIPALVYKVKDFFKIKNKKTSSWQIKEPEFENSYEHQF